jgi:hypothetical protein
LSESRAQCRLPRNVSSSKWDGQKLFASGRWHQKGFHNDSILSRLPRVIRTPFTQVERHRTREKPEKAHVAASGAHRTCQWLTPTCRLVRTTVFFYLSLCKMTYSAARKTEFRAHGARRMPRREHRTGEPTAFSIRTSACVGVSYSQNLAIKRYLNTFNAVLLPMAMFLCNASVEPN